MTIDNTAALNSYSTSKSDALKNLSKDDAALKEKTDGFEAVIVKQMLDIALDEKYSLFPDSAGKDIYKSMYTDTLSNSLAGKFGYSDMLFNFLKERL
ncbi:MAG: rod-binding protein [Campylobacterales bacterium]|nr:rod-binding protein [Campylobacterales bacterium]